MDHREPQSGFARCSTDWKRTAIWRRYTMRRLLRSEAPKAVVLALFGANSQNASNAEVKSEQLFKAAYTLQTAVTDILAVSTRDQGPSVQVPADVGVGSEDGNPATTRS
jgi:hypothetical protein